MPSKISSSLSASAHDWAIWMDSIAQQPHQHKILTQCDDRVEYLDDQEREQERQKGHSVQKLTMEKVLAVTQQVWEDPGIKQAEKRQILEGLRYIHQQREAKYLRLFWLTRIFARFMGAEAQLRAEAQEIERLEADLEIVSSIPVVTKKVVRSEDKIAAQCLLLRKKMEELAQQKEALKEEEKEEWIEHVFSIEKKFLSLKHHLSESQLSEFKSQFKELDQSLAEWNDEMPRLKQIEKAFGRQAIKSTLQETLDSLLEHHHISENDLERDQALFQRTPFEVKILYVKRLVKAARTGLSPSLVTAIERTWEEIRGHEEEGTTYILEGKRVIFIPQDGEIYLKEGYISKGSYKASFIITPFHSLKSEKGRGTLVILQAITEKILDEIDEQEEKSSSVAISIDSPESADSASQNCQLANSPKRSGIISKGVENNNPIKKSGMNTVVPISKSKKISKEKEQKASSSSYNEVDENCKKEGNNCLLYGKLSGVWPTHKVTKVDKQTAIIQPLAGYQLKSLQQQGGKAISLADMCIFLERKQLGKEDQIAFLKMMKHALNGIDSLHQKDVIHRDLKPENILCSEEGLASVSDLGTLCSNMIVVTAPGQPVGKSHNVDKKFLAGSPNFISPESSYYRQNINWTKIGIAVDIWATGLILWEAFSGKELAEHPVHLTIGNRNNDVPPLKVVDFIGEILSNKNKRGDIYNRLYRLPKEKTSLARLIWDCTRPDPTQRPLISEVIQRYDAWARYTEEKMEAGQIQSIQDTFEDAVS